MTILLTGGTGKTSLSIAALLQEAKIPFLLASRNADKGAPSGMHGVKFDWEDESTFEAAFQHKVSQDSSVSAVYIVAPPIEDPVPAMNAFIDTAVKKHGVKRFVLLSGSETEEGGQWMGQTWSHLAGLGVEHCFILASWFMENFSEQLHALSIKTESKIYSACADGKSRFVAVKDIAAVAFRLLTSETPLKETSYRVLGPELLTFDDVAKSLSTHLGRPITHVKLSEKEVLERYRSFEVPEFLAELLTYLEVWTANGNEEKWTQDGVQEVAGQAPQSFDAWAKENKETLLAEMSHAVGGVNV